jgi:alkylhydroperoxidase/carboxymuconolactone decarboxylase family protein YurZ
METQAVYAANQAHGEVSTERTLDQVLAELNDLQLSFVIARVNTRFDREAAAIVNCHEKTPAKWRDRGVPIDEAIRLMKLTAVQSAKEVLGAAALLAAEVLVEELREKGPEKVRAALAVLDRVGLPATQRVEGEIEAAGVMIVLDEPHQV